jgi:hypothetical protein
MDEGMVPFSWLLQRSLQQWEHEDKTTQREGGKDGVRFTTTHGQQERKRGRTYSPSVRLLRFPKLAGMVPVSWLEPRNLQQWEHE